jgi:hypothetical protein
MKYELSRSKDLKISDGYLMQYTGISSDLVIAEPITGIASGVFRDDKALSSVILPDGLEVIENHCFENCSHLISVYIPFSLNELGEYAFAGCTELHNVKLPYGLTKIEPYTFRECHALTSIEIPESVTAIGIGAFSDCTHLTKVTIPESVTEFTSFFDKHPFHGCSKLTIHTPAGSEAHKFAVKNRIPCVTSGTGSIKVGTPAHKASPAPQQVSAPSQSVIAPEQILQDEVPEVQETAPAPEPAPAPKQPSRAEIRRAEKAEAKARAEAQKQKRADEKRQAIEAKAEAKRRAQETKAEEKRLVQEARDEEKRLAQEARAEEKRKAEEAAAARKALREAASDEAPSKAGRKPSGFVAALLIIALLAVLGLAGTKLYNMYYAGPKASDKETVEEEPKPEVYTLTLEDFVKNNETARQQILQSTDGTSVKVAVKDNTLVYTYDLSTNDDMSEDDAKSDELKQVLEENLDSNDNRFIELCGGLEQDTGIKGISVEVIYAYGDDILLSRQYTSAGKQ